MGFKRKTYLQTIELERKAVSDNVLSFRSTLDFSETSSKGLEVSIWVPSYTKQGLLFIAVRRLLIAVTSLVMDDRL